jgi:hypothetical protein
MKRRFVMILFCFVFLASSVPNTSAFDDGSFEAVAADIIVLRPGCFIATIVGSALFLVALPIAAASGSTQETAEALVLHPARLTFQRPMGELSSVIK